MRSDSGKTTGQRFDTISRRYQILGEIGKGGMGIVYRAHDRLAAADSARVVALKQVTVPGQQLEFASSGASMDYRMSLAQEFKTLASLRHPNIISVLDYGFDAQKQPYFTMDLLESGHTIVDAGRELSPAGKLNLLFQLLQALAYLHRRGIMHRDLKPGNVMVIKDESPYGQVKVLDFGLSTKREQVSEDTIDVPIVGTLAYLAPEVLQGAPVSEASDLYAVGVIAYEMFAGRHPFAMGDITQLIMDIVHTPPELDALDVEESLVPVIGRLLSKQPGERFAGAPQIISELNAATNYDFPFETSATRESFLQAAQFIGREGEFQRLSGELQRLLTGQGGAWLSGGESGVGKSRLLDELRSLALVEGALVLRGQSVSEGGVQYQVWREALRWLALLTDLTDLEASVLKPLIPDIAALLNRRVPDAPELDAQGTQDRLLSVIETLFARQTQPIVIILEDLHWAGSESLTLLARLTPIVAAKPVLLVGSYRDDERPDLPSILPGMQVLKLHRLSENSIYALSESMLGEAGRLPEVVQLIQRETEGNVFFMIEVVRTLAEEAGQLEQIGQITLPERVFAGGMQRVLQRRLNRVPENARPLLLAAAVLGRQLDLNLLHDLAGGLDVEAWLITCSDAAVLDVQDGHWRFAHDKLREAALAELPPEQAASVHRTVAEAVERVYPNAPEQNAALAYHWAKAGRSEKEAHYAVLAGEQALLGGASSEAVAFLSRALFLYESLPIPQFDRARAERLLAESYMSAGRLADCREHLKRAVALLGWPMPSNTFSMMLSLTGQLGRQGLHRLLPGTFLGRSASARAIYLEATRIYERMGQMHYIANETIPAFYSSILGLNLAEAAGRSSPELARIYANMGVSFALIPMHRGARFYNRLALQTAQQEAQPSALGWVEQLLGIYHVGVGEWEEGQPYVERATEVGVQMGDGRRWEEAMSIMAYIRYHRSDFAHSAECADGVYNAALRRGDVQMQGTGLYGVFSNQVIRGEFDAALSSADTLNDLCQKSHDMAIYSATFGAWAQTHLYRGELDAAHDRAGQAIELVSQLFAPTAFYIFNGYAGPLEVYLSLWEQNKAPDLQRSINKALKYMRTYARVFPIGKPRQLTLEGLYAYLNGRADKAQTLWNQSLQTAQAFDMRYEQGLVNYHSGRLLGDTARLKQAVALFEAVGALYDQQRAQAAL